VPRACQFVALDNDLYLLSNALCNARYFIARTGAIDASHAYFDAENKI